MAAVTRHHGDLGAPGDPQSSNGQKAATHQARGGSSSWDCRVQSSQLGSASGIFTSSVIRDGLLIHHLKLGLIIVPNDWVVVGIE